MQNVYNNKQDKPLIETDNNRTLYRSGCLTISLLSLQSKRFQ